MITPCDAPMSNVNATTSGRLPVPISSKASAGGSTPIAMRPTEIARKFRAKTISTTRPPNCATPFKDATQTAAAVARPAASSKGTSCTEITPNTNPFSDMISAKSAMAIDRVVPCSGGPSGDATGPPAGPELRSDSRRARPNQCSGKQTARLMSANTTRVCRQPRCSSSAWPTTQNTDEANAPNSVR